MNKIKSPLKTFAEIHNFYAKTMKNKVRNHGNSSFNKWVKLTHNTIVVYVLNMNRRGGSVVGSSHHSAVRHHPGSNGCACPPTL